MNINGVNIIAPSDMHTEEVKYYIDYILDKHKKDSSTITDIEIKLTEDGKDVDLFYTVKPVKFDRIRRVTGYLGNIDNFNNAKQSEIKERVKHK